MVGFVSHLVLALQVAVLGPLLDASSSAVVAAADGPGRIAMYNEAGCEGEGQALEVIKLGGEESSEAQRRSPCGTLDIGDGVIRSARLDEALPNGCTAYFYTNGQCKIVGNLMSGFLYTSDDLERRGKGRCVNLKVGEAIRHRYICF